MLPVNLSWDEMYPFASSGVQSQTDTIDAETQKTTDEAAKDPSEEKIGSKPVAGTANIGNTYIFIGIVIAFIIFSHMGQKIT